jgi:ABC-type transporter Mla subunit MlaD
MNSPVSGDGLVDPTGGPAVSHRSVTSVPMRRAQAYLLRLTPARAFLLFTVALAVGVAAILSGSRWVWVPVVPVLLYGGALAHAQRHLYVQLDGTLKDSPYFLGFILTLFGLFDIFTTLSIGGEAPLDVPLVVGKAGGAILATVAGLFMRQLLLASDPGEEARDAVFQSLAREIRERTVDFHQAQSRFVALVQEFGSAHERMLSREEAAFERYVARLEAGSAQLGRLQEQYPERVESLLATLGDANARLERVGREAEQEHVRLREQLTRRILAAREAQEAELSRTAQTLAAGREAAETQVAALLGSMGRATPELRARVEEIEQALARCGAAADTGAASLAGMARAAAGASQGVESLGSDARSSGSALLRAAEETGGHLRALFHERLSASRDDLAAIDAILDELASVLRERLTVPGETP